MLKRIAVLLLIPFIVVFSQTGEEKLTNPFFMEWSTPYKTPPFNLIKTEHYMPAYLEGIKQHDAEIKSIVDSKDAPTFKNTLEALDNAGELLNKVGSVFGNLNGSNTNEEMQKISKELSPLLSKHYDDVNLNPVLFEKIKTLYDKRESLGLTTEQMMSLKNYYKNFVRRGANLNETDKNKLRKLNEQLSMLSLRYGENVLKETNSFEMVIDNKNDLAGLPETVIAGAADAAKRKGKEGKWLFTLQKPSFIPFLQYAENRELREKIFKGYINRADNNNQFDNKDIIAQIVSLRIQKANLLGYKSHADFILEENMAKTPDKVYDFMKKIWDPALEMAKNEVAEMQKLVNAEGKNFKLEAWDWWYYAEKVKKAKYDLDEEMLRPYFKLENVIAGVFDTAHKLYGITVTERNDIPVYDTDVKTFEVKEADGTHIGIFFADYFPRESKRAGAWSSSFRSQKKVNGKKITPVIINCGNFSKPAGDQPALLSLDEVQTLFHEFGHGLHSLLADYTYPSVGGVPRDFVELPSQIMENWATAPEVLRTYAKHYKTGEVIPDELIAKLENSEYFNKGFETVEYLSAAILDLDYHTLTDTNKIDAAKFEKDALDKIGMIPEIVVRYRSPYFSHVFSGGYSSGYYSYLWAEVLDADAFEAFKESGNLFNPVIAKSFRENVLSKGGSDEAMTLYKNFRGAEPKVEPLLKRKGLL
ncbi:MAG: M3 family metallopeptidase [Melioribacteraceae bacterium]|nr:M3 family metallopeptidase [Melioribacteraceae bacterium]